MHAAPSLSAKTSHTSLQSGVPGNRRPSRTLSHFSIISNAAGQSEDADEGEEVGGYEMVEGVRSNGAALGKEEEVEKSEDGDDLDVYGPAAVSNVAIYKDLERGPDPPSPSDMERNIENTLDLIGFGPYQLRLLILCGLGWTSDNATLQSLALILPRVAHHFSLSTTRASLLSASTMLGMMIGSIAWGGLSDVVGRKIPFNATLGLTGVFNLLGAWVGSFPGLCLVMCAVGSAVGGSMPTDGSLFLENLPEAKQYLLTLLSVFFSLGAVLSSVIGYVALPGHSCLSDRGGGDDDGGVRGGVDTCDIGKGDNDGWRRVLFVLGVINLTMFAGRFLLFKLYESPRYLVANDRAQEALEVVQRIAEFNGLDLQLEMEDVRERGAVGWDAEEVASQVGKGEANDRWEDKGEEGVAAPLLHDQGGPAGRIGNGRPPRVADELGLLTATRNDRGPSTPSPNRRMNSSTPLDLRTVAASTYAAMPQTPGLPEEGVPVPDDYFSARSGTTTQDGDVIPAGYTNGDAGGKLFASRNSRHPPTRLRQMKSFREIKEESKGALDEWIDRIKLLFEPKWKRTTLLMWVIWASISLGYTMFNVWLPTVLETKSSGTAAEGLNEALFEMVLYAAAGCPGSLLGAYAIESSLGRRKSLAIFTLLTAISTFAFTGVSSRAAVVASSMIISVAATAMYAILYGMTPEIFGIEIRGTACGSSAALSRLTGITAPILAGTLLNISPSLPLFTAAAVFAGSAVCALFLPFEKGQSAGPGAGIGGRGRVGGGMSMH